MVKESISPVSTLNLFIFDSDSSIYLVFEDAIVLLGRNIVMQQNIKTITKKIPNVNKGAKIVTRSAIRSSIKKK